MNIDKAIVAELQKRGKITQEEVDDIVSSLLTEEKKQVIELLHTLLCPGHGDKGKCTWVGESTLVDAWERSDHMYWRRRVEGLLLDFEIDSIEALSMIGIATKALGVLGKLDATQRAFVNFLLITVQENSQESQVSSQPQLAEAHESSGLEREISLLSSASQVEHDT